MGFLSKIISSRQPHDPMWGRGYSLAVPREGQGSLVSHLEACRSWCHKDRHSGAGCLSLFHPHPLPAGLEILKLKTDAYTGGRLGSTFSKSSLGLSSTWDHPAACQKCRNLEPTPVLLSQDPWGNFYVHYSFRSSVLLNNPLLVFAILSQQCRHKTPSLGILLWSWLG